MVKTRKQHVHYSDELADDICNAIAAKPHGLRKLCKENPHWPHVDTMFEWIKKHEYFSARYAKAKRNQIDPLIESVLSIAEDDSEDILTNNEGNPVCNSAKINRSRLRIDTIKWLACKLVPKVYGDKFSDTPEGESLIAKLIDKL